ncbi:type II secretion system protein [Sutcliffiella horikoshii]|uniref:type II secretion system protein n=1 Tax=Sutcliffiella horikoshii TaxID=79883 RepID=UPI001F187B77|nr:type II secretion system protein [Sutcliffiella horikoshii]MCG1022200.1 type II secretion system protein [Sutcliffiella horikoshii]
MELLKNNKGYTVLIVLLTIVVIGLIAPPLVSGVMNSTLQNKKTEEKVQAQNLIDMGKQYFRNELSQSIHALGDRSNPTQIKSKLESSLLEGRKSERILLSSSPDRLEYEVNYEITNIVESSQIMITYQSIAYINGVKHEEENNEEEFILNYKLGAVPSDPNDYKCLEDNMKNNGTVHLSGKKHCIITGTQAINFDIKITGQAILEVKSPGIRFNNTVFIAGKGSLYIQNDQQKPSSLTLRGKGSVNIGSPTSN